MSWHLLVMILISLVVPVLIEHLAYTPAPIIYLPAHANTQTLMRCLFAVDIRDMKYIQEWKTSPNMTKKSPSVSYGLHLMCLCMDHISQCKKGIYKIGFCCAFLLNEIGNYQWKFSGVCTCWRWIFQSVHQTVHQLYFVKQRQDLSKKKKGLKPNNNSQIIILKLQNTKQDLSTQKTKKLWYQTFFW